MKSHDLRQALTRREFLRGAAGVGLAGAGILLLGACGSEEDNASPTGTPGTAVEPPPETTTIRLSKLGLPREAPFIVAEQFLPGEGFTDVQYIETSGNDQGIQQIAAGEIDIGLSGASALTAVADADERLVVLAGVQSSAFELFGSDRVQSLRDLRGKRIHVNTTDPHDLVYTFWAALLAYVGLDLEHDVEFVELPNPDDFVPQVLAGTIDAWLLSRPASTILRNANIGHLVIDLMVDPPWSQYFGAMATAKRDFVEQHPAATKRALRAILKATDVCAREPDRAARYLIDRGFSDSPYDQTLDGIRGPSYAAWRAFDPEDTMRFYALRLKEAGLVTSTPDELIARATDWHYLNEIKRELREA